MGIIASGLTDIGRKRKTNQDAFSFDVASKYFIIADGMGGHNGGDIASQMAVKHFSQYVKSHAEDEPKSMLVQAIKSTNRIIKDYGETKPELVGMGTTIISFYFRGQNIFIGNVGDSRAYLVSNKKIYQLSRDHSLVQEKLNYGIYNREQAADDPQKNVLVKTVGFDTDVDPDIFTYKVVRNDIFMCCSDGLHGKISDEDIVFVINELIPEPSIATQENVDKAVKRLVDLANENGGQDNITIIIIIAQ